jgi:hypothetical protein
MGAVGLGGCRDRQKFAKKNLARIIINTHDGAGDDGETTAQDRTGTAPARKEQGREGDPFHSTPSHHHPPASERGEEGGNNCGSRAPGIGGPLPPPPAPAPPLPPLVLARPSSLPPLAGAAAGARRSTPRAPSPAAPDLRPPHTAPAPLLMPLRAAPSQIRPT